MRVGILGCGALGGVMAVRLAEVEGIHLEVYNSNPEIARAVEERGLVLLDRGRKTVRRVRLLPAPPAPGAGDRPLDLVILATKSVGLVEAARGLLPALGEGGVLVTTQNGLVALDLAEALGPERVVAGVVLWGASMDAPGVYRVTAHGPFVIGPPGPGLDRAAAVVDRVAAVLGQVFPVRSSANMPGVLWSKLAITASLTTLGAVTGLSFGELVRRRDSRRLLLGLGSEVLAAARSTGVSLEPLAGGLDMERLLSPSGSPGAYPAPLRHLLIRLIGWKHRSTESSMLDSLRRGRRTEIGFINGRVVELCKEAGLPCPLNQLAVELVRELEKGTGMPAVEQLERFAVG
ncbi:MAG: 2-dehydropantoate 2-reductase [Spirochaetales bacterium]|nr:2-dehydropantoate 2-reductase [Spirochaetales bacterium]